jgi:hypothetical protein
MKLYHGSNEDIETIDLTKGLRYKEFGTMRALQFLHKINVEVL